MAKVECPHCRKEISDSEPLTVRGLAKVEGTATLLEFHNEGVDWIVHDSWDEEFICPHCGHAFTPDFVRLREEWRDKGEESVTKFLLDTAVTDGVLSRAELSRMTFEEKVSLAESICEGCGVKPPKWSE